MILRNRGDDLFMAGFDRETSPGTCLFRLYRGEADGILKEIERTEFPKELAIQNLWLDDHDAQVQNPMDPENRHFQSSLTGRLWQYLETGIQYWEEARPDADFLVQYRDANLKGLEFGETTMPGALVGGSRPEYRRVR